jgi:hypothetical protein
MVVVGVIVAVAGLDLHHPDYDLRK